jgi:hypothetical protein
VIGDRHRDRHVDADHPGLDLALEAAGGAAVVGEDRGAVAVGTGVDELDPFGVRRHPHNRQHGTEDLVLVGL